MRHEEGKRQLYLLCQQYKKGKTANYLFSSSVINSAINCNQLMNPNGTPRNDRSIICKRPSQLYQTNTQLISQKGNLRSLKSTEKPLYSSLSIQNNASCNKEVFCFEDDVQQLNIASEENDQMLPIEPVTLDSTKGERASIASDATLVSPIQIKKIMIENYRNEKSDKGIMLNEESESGQGMPHHSLSFANQSPVSQGEAIELNSETGDVNAKDSSQLFSEKKEMHKDCQINHSNFFFNIPSINIIYKSQENKERSKSFARNQMNYSNFEKLKKPTHNQIKHYYQKGASLKQVTHPKRIKSFVDKALPHEMYNQWDTLSSRIKSSNATKVKDTTNSYSAGINQTVKANYPIVSEINKKLFNDFNSTFNKKYSNSHSNNSTASTNYAQHHQKKLKSIGPFKRKEYLNLVKNLDDNNFSKIIQIIDRISVDPLSKTMKERASVKKGIEDNDACIRDVTGIKHISLTTIAKSTASSTASGTVKKQCHNVREIKVNYIKTDLFPLNQSDNTPKFALIKARQPNYSVLSVTILSNWGNKAKVGVTEIQLFDEKGRAIPVIKCHVFNGTEDNISRIVNKKTHTINDNDMWSTPLVPNIKIEVYFDSSVYDVASVNIWNYNGKDLQRGIKEIEVSRRNSLCWRGVVPKGCFNTKTDYSLKIKLPPTTLPIELKQSETLSFYQSHPKIPYDLINNDSNGYSLQSPNKTLPPQIKLSNINIDFNELTSSARNRPNMITKSEEELNSLRLSLDKASRAQCLPQFIAFSKIRIDFKESYGCTGFIGLTGMRFVDKEGHSYSVDTASSVGALPKDVNSEYNIDDPQIFENVFNNINETNDISNMWLTVFNSPYIEICYDTQQTLSQLVIWNYNDPESLGKCTKTIEVTFDDDPSTTCEVRLMKGTGLSQWDYSQSIDFPFLSPVYDNILLPANDATLFYENDFVSPLLPSGFWFKFVLLSNHGGLSYIGLNAIEFFDSNDQLMVPLKILNDPEMRLIKGNYTSINQYWATSYCNMNSVDSTVEESLFTVIFDRIVQVAYVKLFNLVREPKQGVKSFQIICDDFVIFEGEMKEANADDLNESCVVFVNDEKILRSVKGENVIGRPVKREKRYSTRETKNGFAMTLKGYD